MSLASTVNKDALHVPDDTKDIETNRVNEKILFEENSTVFRRDTFGNSWIVGSSTNGLVGTNTGTQGGGQQVVGSSARVVTKLAVVNPNNTYREHFRDTNFKDTGAKNTADWNTTLFRIAMSTSSNHATVYNTIAHSHSIALNDGTITSVKLTAIERRWNPLDVIKYFLTADGGSTWEEVTNGTSYSFIHTGVDLKFRIIFLGNGAKDTYIEELKITYVSTTGGAST